VYNPVPYFRIKWAGSTMAAFMSRYEMESEPAILHIIKDRERTFDPHNQPRKTCTRRNNEKYKSARFHIKRGSVIQIGSGNGDGKYI